MASVENTVVTRFVASVSDFRNKVEQIRGDIEGFGKESQKSFRQSTVGMFAFGAAISATTISLAAFAKESFDAAARVEELDIAMQAIGASTGVGYEALRTSTQAIRDNGIELAASQKIAIEFAQNQLDLASAAKVARVAQDLAVVGAKNSTETTLLLTRAVITGNSTLLRSAGIQRYVSDGYKKYAASVGKTVKELTMSERQQATINLILDEGAKVAGTYEASMETAGKVLRSFKRIVNDIQIELGSALLKGFGPIIKGAYDLLSAFSKSLREGGKFHDFILALSYVFQAAAKPIGDVLKTLKKFFVPTKPYEELKAGIKAVANEQKSLIETADRLNGRQRDLGDSTKYASDRVQKLYDILRKTVPVVAAFAAAFAAKQGQNVLQFFQTFAPLAKILNPVVIGFGVFVALMPQVQSQLLALAKIGGGTLIPILKELGTTIVVGLADGVAQLVNIFGGLVSMFVALIKPITDFGLKTKVAAQENQGLIQSIRNLRPMISVAVIGFVAYKAAVIAATIATKAFAAVKGSLILIMAATNVAIKGLTAAFVALRTAVGITGATLLLMGTITKAVGITTVATQVIVGGFTAALKALRAGLIAAGTAAALFSLKLMLPIVVIGAIIVAVYQLYKGMKKYFGESGNTVDDFVMDIALGIQGALRHLDTFLNNLSRFAANVQAFFTRIGKAVETGLAGDIAGAVKVLQQPLEDFMPEKILEFDMAGAMDPFIKYLKENKPAGKFVEFGKGLLDVLFNNNAAVEELLETGGDGAAKAAKDAFKKFIDEYKKSLTDFYAAQQQFKEMFDRPFGLEPSEIEKSFGIEGTTQSVVSMSRQLRRAIIDMYKPLLDTKLYRDEAVKSAKQSMDKQLADLEDFGRRLYQLHAQRQQIQKDLARIEGEYNKAVGEINDKFDKLDEGAQKAIDRLEKYYDNLIKGLQKTLDSSRAAFEKENDKLSEILKERDNFLDKAKKGLVGFVRGLNFKSAAAEAAKSGERAGKVIETTVKDLGNGIRVTIQKEVEPAMQSLADLKITSTDIRQQLNERLTALKEFATNIRTLAARGLSSEMLQEFADAGVSQAGEVVSALAGASDAELAEINAIQSELAAQVQSFAEFASSQWYAASVAQQEAIVAPLKQSYEEAQSAFDNATILREAELAAAQEQARVLRELRATELATRFAEYTREKEELEKQAKDIDDQLKKLAVEAYDFFVTLGFKSAEDMFNNGKTMADNIRKGFKDRFPGLKNKLNSLMDGLAASMNRTSYVDVVTRYSVQYEKLPGLAAGGPVTAKQAYIVGERGPELFMPHMSGQIINAAETRRALAGMSPNVGSMSIGGGGGGNSYQINVNVPVTANSAEIGRQVVDAITAFERRNGRVYEPA